MNWRWIEDLKSNTWIDQGLFFDELFSVFSSSLSLVTFVFTRHIRRGSFTQTTLNRWLRKTSHSGSNWGSVVAITVQEVKPSGRTVALEAVSTSGLMGWFHRGHDIMTSQVLKVSKQDFLIMNNRRSWEDRPTLCLNSPCWTHWGVTLRGYTETLHWGVTLRRNTEPLHWGFTLRHNTEP